MKVNDSEKLNLAIIHGNRAYKQWEQDHDIPNYLMVILYELLLRKKIDAKTVGRFKRFAQAID